MCTEASRFLHCGCRARRSDGSSRMSDDGVEYSNSVSAPKNQIAGRSSAFRTGFECDSVKGFRFEFECAFEHRPAFAGIIDGICSLFRFDPRFRRAELACGKRGEQSGGEKQDVQFVHLLSPFRLIMLNCVRSLWVSGPLAQRSSRCVFAPGLASLSFRTKPMTLDLHGIRRVTE